MLIIIITLFNCGASTKRFGKNGQKTWESCDQNFETCFKYSVLRVLSNVLKFRLVITIYYSLMTQINIIKKMAIKVDAICRLHLFIVPVFVFWTIYKKF